MSILIKQKFSSNGTVNGIETHSNQLVTENIPILPIEEEKSDDIDDTNRYTEIDKKIGNNVICCDNIIVGKAYFSIILSMLLVSFPCALLFYLLVKNDEVKYSSSFNIIQLILYFFTMVFIVYAGGTNPGIFERRKQV